MITIQHLSKKYGDIEVLKDIDLQVNKGEIHGLIGVSGAGKSTLLRCINGLETYDEGTLLVEGVDIRSLKNWELRQFKRKIGMIFQNFALLERRTVFQNVALPMSCWHFDMKEKEERVLELLELVGIAHKKDARPSELSGGQKQRVAIARALTLSPDILLCDEATSALDPKTTDSVLSLLSRINRKLGITMVVVTHEMSVVKSICDRMSIMDRGEIKASDSVKNIFIKEPAILNNLIGKQPVLIPKGKLGIKIHIDHHIIDDPVIFNLMTHIGQEISIVKAQIDEFREGRISFFHLAIDQNKREETITYLRQQGIPYSLLEGGSSHDIDTAF